MTTEGTWLRTTQGDLDPLWLLLISHLVLGFALTIVGIVTGGTAFVIAVVNNILSVLILAVIKVPIDRARLLAPALTKGVEALPVLSRPPHPGMDQHED
jgi:hypothetical protein